MKDTFNGFYRGKRVLVTGHTGFKGSWLSIWLHGLGAEVIGVGLDPYTEKDNFVLSGIGDSIKADLRGDIRDGARMKDNLRLLLSLVGQERVTVRVPLIPGCNTPEHQARSVAALKALGVTRLDVFEYVIREE